MEKQKVGGILALSGKTFECCKCDSIDDIASSNSHLSADEVENVFSLIREEAQYEFSDMD